ncbi:hypothetical protein ACLOJK_003733 [Asimina triloba]
MWVGYMIPFGLSSALSTGVSNVLGAGQTKAARLAACVAFLITITEGVIVGSTSILVRNIWGYLYSNEEEVVKYVARMLPVLANSNFLDGVQCLLSGIARGCGWQKLHEDLDLDLEVIMMSVAIWRSIQDLGQPCESSSTVECRSSGHVSNLCGLSPASVDDRDIPPADSIKAGLAIAVASMADHNIQRPEMLQSVHENYLSYQSVDGVGSSGASAAFNDGDGKAMKLKTSLKLGLTNLLEDIGADGDEDIEGYSACCPALFDRISAR